MIARACFLLVVCLLANSGAAVVGSPSTIGHPPPTAGQHPATPAKAVASQPVAQPVAQPAQPAKPARTAASAAASDSGPFKLTVDAIMQGPKLVGYPPSGLRWSGDSQRLYFEWRLPDEDEAATWVVGRNAGEPRRLSDEERKLAPPTSGASFGGGGAGGGPPSPVVWDKAKRRVLALQNGDIVLIDTVAQTRRTLMKTVAPESNPRWTHDETAITFTRENALYLLPLNGDGDGLVQLTDAGPRKQDPRLTDSQKFVKAEEEALFGYVRDQVKKEKKNEEKRDREQLPKFEITDRQSIPDLLLAQDDTHVYALIVERAQGSKRVEVPNYVSISGYTEDIPGRTKVGDAQDTRRVAILNLKTKKQVWASLDLAGSTPQPPQTTEPKNEPKDENRRQVQQQVQQDENGNAAFDPDVYSQPGPPTGAPDTVRRAEVGARSDALGWEQRRSRGTPPQTGEASAQTEGDRGTDAKDAKKGPDLRWGMPQASRDGKHLVVSVRSGDNKDWWLCTPDPETGKARVLDHVHDDAWVRSGGDFGGGLSGWLPDNQHYWYVAEHDGWMHLYTIDPASSQPGNPTQITSGKWEVSTVDLSPDEKEFYITSTEAHPGERQLYRVPLAGGVRTRVTTMVGASQVEASPDGQLLGVIYSASAKPPEVYLMPNKPGAPMTQVTTSTSAAWRSYKWIAPELVTVPARDGAQVYARLYTPEMVGAKRSPLAPAVLFVHGAGYLQDAHKYWSSSYYREHMFNHLLASRGYVVLDMDYRASAGYGRDWRTAIYRHMGGTDLDDIVDGAKWLVQTQKVNAKRIGLYGGSYGGFITLMAMFTQPDVFAAGAALRPVTDWAHYNHGYTSNILNEPQNDAQAYRQSSPIYFADRLKGALLICHGMVDTNVNFQDTVRLVQRLIELRKENWELAVYPVENHGFEQETSWADEYKRILKLFETNLKK
jgi:dipeptidyl aminopeptidase/acylaminoacyl peptidase